MRDTAGSDGAPVWHRRQLRKPGGSAAVAPAPIALSFSATGPEVQTLNIGAAAGRRKRAMRRRSNSLPSTPSPREVEAKTRPAFTRAQSLLTSRMTKITPGLYIGDRDDAKHLGRLTTANVTHILNAASLQVPRHHGRSFAYCGIPVYDAPETNLTPYFDRACAFLGRCRSAGGIALAHCIAGVARSVSFAIASLMANNRMRLRAAYNLVKKKRPIMCPNESFRYQLAKFEIHLFGDSSVAGTCNEKAWDFYKWNLERRGVVVHVPLDGKPLSELECCTVS
jgi:hypothetical protein